MALPLLLLGGAAIAGMAAGASAKGDYNEAERRNKKAKKTLKRAKRSLKFARDLTQGSLEDLGRQKVHLHEHGMKPFVDAFSHIKEVDYAGLTFDANLPITEVDTLDIQRTVTEMDDLVGPGTAALGAGALAGLATYGSSAGVLGTASAGTAVAGLSGATNATLVWLSGGSLVAGGGGIAGAAVLGGIVAAPLLLVGGFVMKSQAKDALKDAKSNLKKAKVHAEAMDTAKVACAAIYKKANEVWEVLNTLQGGHLDNLLPKLNRLVSTNPDYRTYNDEQKRLVMQTAAVAKTAHLVAEAPLLAEDGAVTKEIRHALKNATNFLKTINAM